jgi:hypothetical protein
MDSPQSTQPVSPPPAFTAEGVDAEVSGNGPESRSCFGCLFTGGLGCLGFGFGAVLGAIILAPALLSGLGTRMAEGFANAALSSSGSFDFEEIGLSWTRPQDVSQIRILDAEGNEVLVGEGTMPSLLTMLGFGDEEWRYEFRVTSGSIDFDLEGVSNLTKALELQNGEHLGLDFSILAQVPSAGVLSLRVENVTLTREGEKLGEVQSAEFRYVHDPDGTDQYFARFAFGSPEAVLGPDQDVSVHLAPGVFVAQGTCAQDDQDLHFHFLAREVPFTLLDAFPGGAGLRGALGERGDVDVTLDGKWKGSRIWQGGVEGEKGDLNGRVRLDAEGPDLQRVVAEVDLPTAIVDLLVALPWSLEGALGSRVSLRLLGDVVTSDQRRRLERAHISLLTPLQERSVQILLEGDAVRSVVGATSHLELGLDDPLCEDVLSFLLPWLEVVEKGEGSDPVRLAVGEFILPVSGSELPASAEITIDLGQVSYRLHPLFSEGILRAGVGRGVYEDDLEPFKLSVQLGRVAYEEILLLLDEEECVIRGAMDLDTQELSLDVELPASFLPLEGSEAVGEMAMTAVVRGRWSKPQLSYTSEVFEVWRAQLDLLRGVFDED